MSGVLKFFLLSQIITSDRFEIVKAIDFHMNEIDYVISTDDRTGRIKIKSGLSLFQHAKNPWNFIGIHLLVDFTVNGHGWCQTTRSDTTHY